MMASTTPIRALPTAAEAREIEDALQHTFDLLERVGWAVRDTYKTDGPDYPHSVTFETMGVLADLHASLESRIEDFQAISKQIDEAMFSVGTIRAEQLGSSDAK
jgi:hypothetical protein